MSDDFSDVFAAIDAQSRPASVATVGGFRPRTIVQTSTFGGHFVGMPDEGWPIFNGREALPLLQVRIDELPVSNPRLDGIALLNIYVSDDLPEPFASNGQSWLIRTYQSLEQLVPIQPRKPVLKPYQIAWAFREHDFPGWEDFDSPREVRESDEFADMFFARYQSVHATKVGGFPTFAQSSVGVDGYVLQMCSEEKSGWAWADSGFGHLYFRDGEWSLYWDCY